MSAAIQVEKLSKGFGSDKVLTALSVDFEEGQIHGIVGNNGSGKTVFMKCICGFLSPDSGRVLVYGKEIGRDVDFPEETGIIIETPGFLSSLSGIRNLQLLASLGHKCGKDAIRQAMERVGLDPQSKKVVKHYSLGMRQRLGIAQAIMEEPSLLILDEPFNGLDKKGVVEMRELLLSLRDEGKTILLASHNQTDIDVLCDTVHEMDDGQLIPVKG